MRYAGSALSLPGSLVMQQYPEIREEYATCRQGDQGGRFASIAAVWFEAFGVL